MRRAGHVLAACAGWVGLAALWVWQLRLGVPGRWVDGPTFVLVVFVIWIGLLRSWVGWSRSIYRRRHRRTSPVILPVDFIEDSLGRRVRAQPGTRTAHTVTVSVTLPGVKVYEPAAESQIETEEVA